MLTAPHENEYAPFYADYIRRSSPSPDVIKMLTEQMAALKGLLQSVTDEQALYRPTPQDWNIKEVLGHLIDCERIFSYRALCFSRNDPAPLPGFDQEVFVKNANFSDRPVADLLEELSLLRAANLLMFKSLPADRLMQGGTASDYHFTTRALVYITAGHMDVHLESLKKEYLPALV